MTDQTAHPGAGWLRWWGGRLSDGTMIVLNPHLPAPVEVYDLTTGEQPPTWHSTPPRGWRGWMLSRVGNSDPPTRGTSSLRPASLTGAPLRRSISLAALCVTVGVTAAVMSPSGALATGTWAAAVFVAAVAVYAWSEGRPLRLGTVTEMPTMAAPADTDPTRYVPNAVARTTEWQTLVTAADSLGNSDARAPELHRVLWKAANLRAYEDTQTMADPSHMDDLVAEATRLMTRDPHNGPST